MTTGQLTLLDVATTNWFIYQGLRVEVVSSGNLDRETIDLLRRVGDSLAKKLTELGLERRLPAPEDLGAHLEEKSRERAVNASNSASDEDLLRRSYDLGGRNPE